MRVALAILVVAVVVGPFACTDDGGSSGALSLPVDLALDEGAAMRFTVEAGADWRFGATGASNDHCGENRTALDGQADSDLVVRAEVTFLDGDADCDGVGVFARSNAASVVACSVSHLEGPPGFDGDGDGEPDEPPGDDYYETSLRLARIDAATGSEEPLAYASSRAAWGGGSLVLETDGAALRCRIEGLAELDVTAEDPDPAPGTIGLIAASSLGSISRFEAAPLD